MPPQQLASFVSVVLYLSQHTETAGVDDLAHLTRTVVHVALSHGGTFHLPYQQHYTHAAGTRLSRPRPVLHAEASLRPRPTANEQAERLAVGVPADISRQTPCVPAHFCAHSLTALPVTCWLTSAKTEEVWRRVGLRESDQARNDPCDTGTEAEVGRSAIDDDGDPFAGLPHERSQQPSDLATVAQIGRVVGGLVEID